MFTRHFRNLTNDLPELDLLQTKGQLIGANPKAENETHLQTLMLPTGYRADRAKAFLGDSSPSKVEVSDNDSDPSEIEREKQVELKSRSDQLTGANRRIESGIAHSPRQTKQADQGKAFILPSEAKAADSDLEDFSDIEKGRERELRAAYIQSGIPTSREHSEWHRKRRAAAKTAEVATPDMAPQSVSMNENYAKAPKEGSTVLRVKRNVDNRIQAFERGDEEKPKEQTSAPWSSPPDPTLVKEEPEAQRVDVQDDTHRLHKRSATAPSPAVANQESSGLSAKSKDMSKMKVSGNSPRLRVAADKDPHLHRGNEGHQWSILGGMALENGRQQLKNRREQKEEKKKKKRYRFFPL